MKNTIAILIFLFSTSSFALTGNELFALMKDDPLDAVYYIKGAIEMQEHRLNTDKQFIAHVNNDYITSYFCRPVGSTFGQAYDVVKNYLEDNPATRNYSAPILIHLALLKVWRCSAEN